MPVSPSLQIPLITNKTCQILIETTNSDVYSNNQLLINDDEISHKNTSKKTTDNYILKRRHSWSKRESFDNYTENTSKNLLFQRIENLDTENLKPNNNDLLISFSCKDRQTCSFKDIQITKSVSYIRKNVTPSTG